MTGNCLNTHIGQKEFLLTCLLRGMTGQTAPPNSDCYISTHMPLARHDGVNKMAQVNSDISTHMPLARHDDKFNGTVEQWRISTHMPLARHDKSNIEWGAIIQISTHMPLARHDRIRGNRYTLLLFLLTCLLRGMTFLLR